MENMDDESVREKIAEIILEILSKSAQETISSEVVRGAFQGEIGERNMETLNFSELQHMLEIYKHEADQLKQFGSLSEEATFLVSIGTAVVNARQSFMDNDTAKGKGAIAQLKEIGEEFALPEALEEELEQMSVEITYRECLNNMKAALVVEQPVQYLISMVKSRKRTVSTGKVTNTSITASSPGNPNNSNAEGGQDELLTEEEMMLNDAALDTLTIERVLRQVSQVQDTLESEELPETFFHHVQALEAIKKLRDAVKKMDWTEAYTTISNIQRDYLLERVPDIASEVEAALEPVQNFAVISACKNALSKGLPTGPVGQLDFKSVTLEPLEEAARLCETIGCHTPRAEDLRKAVAVITELRRAQKSGDWDAIRAAITRADDEGIGTGTSAFCLGEINRSIMERDNHDLIQSLKNAVIKEEVLTKESLLDLENASVNELSGTFARAANFPEDTRGPILKTLMSLSEVVLKARRAAIKKDWFLVESLLPVVKDFVESFQNDIEKSDRVITQRKTVSFRGSTMFRGSVLARTGSGNVSAEASPVVASPASSPLGAPSTVSKSAIWEEFTALTDVIKREMKSVENHFAVLKLETDLTRLLKENGIQSEVIGSIDKALIKTEELQAALQLKADMETAQLTLPEAVVKLGKIGTLVVDMRQAVLADKWDTISAMLEDTLNGGLGTLPEYTRGEILIVRRELENRWIISTLTNALQTGKLEGELGKANLKNVSCEHLMSYISTAKSLNPRTDFALLLLYTAECIHPLRKLICQPEIDWPAVSKLAKKLLNDVQRQKVHPSVLPELRLVAATAEDTILCNTMRAALTCGAPMGQPGELDLSPVSTQQLEAAAKLIARSQLKTDAAVNMSNAVRGIYQLRETLLQTQVSEDPAYTWSAVKAVINAIAEARKLNPTDDSWLLCQAELELVEKHMHIEEIQHRLLECVIKTSQVYAERNASPVNRLDPPQGYVPPSGEASELFCSALDAIIDAAKALKFESEYLDRYVGCATTLRVLRLSITKDNWSALEEMLRDPSVRHNLKILPEAEKELAWVLCEFHNHRALEIITTALKTAHHGETTSQTEEDFELITNVADFAEHNEILEQAMVDVKKYKITSKAAIQLLDCCRNVLQLRRSLQNQDNDLVAQSLRWFQANVRICPAHVQIEAQQAYVLHQNDLLSKSLQAALLVGKPMGPCGNLRVADIEVAQLETLLNQASEVTPKFKDVEGLCEAARVVVAIRRALQASDLTELSEIVEMLSEKEHFHLLIVDEIATARAELDNDVTTRALIDSLKSFDDAESKALDMTFMSNGNGESGSIDASDSPGKSPRPGFSILQTFSQRRYSFANKGNANIDPETIDIDVLDGGLRIAEDHGVFSSQARALYRTVHLVRSLRVAMKQSEWPKLEDILAQANFEENIGVKYDALASKEIQALRSQLEMRAAIVDLSKSLKIGWAKCSNGIVDTSSLSNDTLENAIERANRSITELSLGSTNEDGGIEDDDDGSEANETSDMDGGDTAAMKRRVSFVSEDMAAPERHPEEKATSMVQKQVDLLMESARLVLRIREILLSGKMELAGSLAEEALNGRLHYSVVDELKLYSKEINTALSTMRVFESLRSGMLEGNIDKLAGLINTAKNNDLHYNNDLGMIRTLDRAETVYYALMEIRKQASALSDVFDTEALRKTIDQAVKYNMAERELEQTRNRLEKLLAFEALVEEVTQRSHGVLSDSAALELIIKHATQLNLAKHPVAKSAELRLRFSYDSFRTAVVGEGIVHKNLYVLATETIRLKRHYLHMVSSATKYKLENFPNLRRPQDFGVRMNIASEELRRTMLVHSDQPLPTSLTKQSPVLAALSVTVFAQYVRGIERNMYSDFSIVLRRLLKLGRAHPPMRDEVLLLLIKQMRNNMEVGAVTRLWKCLSACLYHFPPSMSFESYLELYLIQSGMDSSHFIGYTQRCIRYMHQSIIRFGYARKITADFNESLEEMRLWFHDTAHDPMNPAAKTETPTPAASKAKASATAAATSEVPEGSLELTDPAFMAALDRKQHAATLSKVAAGPGTTHEVRGSREDWIARFRLFNHDNSSKEGGHMTKNKFAASVAASITPEGRVDQFDRDVFYFLLFGKHVSNGKAVVREYASADVLFHSTSEDELMSSAARRAWLDANMPTIDKSSELFFSQLKGPDLSSYAERFWDNIVEKMSVECPNFPFLKWEGEAHRKPSIKNGGSDVTINWELYREIVLIGMKKFIDRAKSARATVTTTMHEDFKMTGFTMHHVDTSRTKAK